MIQKLLRLFGHARFECSILKRLSWKICMADRLRHEIVTMMLGTSHGEKGYRADDGEYNLACDFQDLYYSYGLYQRYADGHSLRNVLLTYSVFSPGHDTIMTKSATCCVAFKVLADIPYRNEEVARAAGLPGFEKTALRKAMRHLKKSFSEHNDHGNECAYWSCYANLTAKERAAGHLKNNNRGNDMSRYVRAMFAETKKRGQKLMVIIPPARKGYRDALPPKQQLFRELWAIKGLFILDLFDNSSFGDSDFLDQDHLTMTGAVKFTRLVREALRGM